jgi:hypothetical protein
MSENTWAYSGGPPSLRKGGNAWNKNERKILGFNFPLEGSKTLDAKSATQWRSTPHRDHALSTRAPVVIDVVAKSALKVGLLLELSKESLGVDQGG